MKLLELFNAPLPYTWDEKYSEIRKIFAHFDVDGIKIEVMFTRYRPNEDGSDATEWSVGFHAGQQHGSGDFGNKGIQVFTTVVHIIDEFFNKKNAKSILVEPMSQKLHNLYKRMGVYFSKKYDYKPGDTGGFLITKKVMEQDTLELPDIEVGDEVKIGKWKNRKATVKGFKKDKKDNHPVLKTTKGDTKLFKPRITKIEEAKYDMSYDDLIDNFVNLWSTGDEWGDTVGTLFDVAIELWKRGEGPPYDWDFRPGAGMKMYRDNPRPKNFRQDPNEEGNPELRYADTTSLVEFGDRLRAKRDRLEHEGKSY